ncbi:MAG TPA: hypothetical protein VK666_00955, partial [Chryseolinea sp.]|nr:hypothetical protein [Chryseolinea sp.]
IVEAYDGTNTVRFNFDGISKPAPTIILPPENGVKATDKEFSRFQEMAGKDPEAYSKLMAQYNGPSGPRIDMKPGSGPVTNNPIEIPEKR